MVVSVKYPVQWVRPKIDLVELAKLRRPFLLILSVVAVKFIGAELQRRLGELINRALAH